MTRALVFALSLLAAVGISFRGAAWMAYEEGMVLQETEETEGRGTTDEGRDTKDEGRRTKDAVLLMQKAARLDPFKSEYPYEEYYLTEDLAALKRAITLEPSKPAYHAYYGLKLIEREPENKEAVKEVCLGAELKPYSAEYKSACEEVTGTEGR